MKLDNLIMKCNYCGKEVMNPTKSQKYHYKERERIYCSKQCGKEYSRKISSETMSKTNRKYASARMKINNPMRNEESRKKVSNSLKGRKPSIVCGNGRGLTKPQKQLLEELLKYEALAEYAISTKGHIGLHPLNYKIDIALPKYKLAIEIDGNSHRALKRKIEDEKKTLFLNDIGWKVIRFWNKEVNDDIEKVKERIEVIINEI